MSIERPKVILTVFALDSPKNTFMWFQTWNQVSDLESGFKVAQATSRFIKIWYSVEIFKKRTFFFKFSGIE